MSEILNTKGGMVKIYDNKDFALFLDESLGYEIGDYFRIALEDVANAATGENRCTGACDCTGECDTVYEIEEHWHRIVQDIHDELVSWEISKKTKRDLEEMRNYLVRRINAEL